MTARQKLKAQLSHGDINRIAAIAGVHRTTVGEWFRGENNNQTIEVTVEKLLKKRKEQLEERLEKVTQADL